MSEDDEMVTVRYSASSNISFKGERELVTRADWKAMSSKEREQALIELLFELVDVYVEDE